MSLFKGEVGVVGINLEVIGFGVGLLFKENWVRGEDIYN